MEKKETKKKIEKNDKLLDLKLVKLYQGITIGNQAQMTFFDTSKPTHLYDYKLTFDREASVIIIEELRKELKILVPLPNVCYMEPNA